MALVIIGAGGLGREVFRWARDAGRCVKGFLDENPDALANLNSYPPILGTTKTYQIAVEDTFLCAIGNSKFRQKEIDLITERGGKFDTLIHPRSICYSPIPKGCIVAPFAYVAVNVQIGENSLILLQTCVGHDVKIGKNCRLDVSACICGSAVLEDNVTVHAGAKILPNIKIGAESSVLAGSLVMTNVPPGTFVFGMPATELKL